MGASTTRSQWSGGAKTRRLVKSTGLVAIRGAPTGESTASSGWRCTSTIWPLSRIVCGPLQGSNLLESGCLDFEPLQGSNLLESRFLDFGQLLVSRLPVGIIVTTILSTSNKLTDTQ